MPVIDCDGFFGFRAAASDDTSIETVLRLADTQGVSYVMAYSLRGRTCDAREGNDHALEVARQHPRLLPVACVDPRAHRHVEDEIERVADLGFVAVRVFPELQGWSVDSVLFTRVVNTCAENDIPLMVTAKAAGVASQVVRLSGHTSSPIILLGVGYAILAEAISAASIRPNTLISTQFFVTPGAIEIAAEAIGADNLVLGTGSPDNCIRPAVNMILGSELSREDKRKVLGGNIRRLIEDRLARFGRKLSVQADFSAYDRLRPQVPIIDVHGHLGNWPFPMSPAGIEDIRELMRRRGIARSILSSTRAIVDDFVEGNAELARDIEGCDNIYGYVTINPNHPKKSIEEMDHYLSLPNFIGVKFHPSYAGVSIDSPAARALAPAIAERDVPLLVHTCGPGEPAKVGKLAQEHPGMRILMGHGGMTAWREALEVLKNHPNTYVEFCSSLCDRHRIRATIDEAGVDRVLFGSDLGLFDPAYDLGMYEEAILSPVEQAAVMRDNALRLFFESNRFGLHPRGGTPQVE